MVIHFNYLCKLYWWFMMNVNYRQHLLLILRRLTMMFFLGGQRRGWMGFHYQGWTWSSAWFESGENWSLHGCPPSRDDTSSSCFVVHCKCKHDTNRNGDRCNKLEDDANIVIVGLIIKWSHVSGNKKSLWSLNLCVCGFCIIQEYVIQ